MAVRQGDDGLVHRENTAAAIVGILSSCMVFDDTGTILRRQHGGVQKHTAASLCCSVLADGARIDRDDRSIASKNAAAAIAHNAHHNARSNFSARIFNTIRLIPRHHSAVLQRDGGGFCIDTTAAHRYAVPGDGCLVQRELGTFDIHGMSYLHRIAIRIYRASQCTIFYSYICVIGHGKEGTACRTRGCQRITTQIKGEFLAADSNIFRRILQQHHRVAVTGSVNRLLYIAILTTSDELCDHFLRHRRVRKENAGKNHQHNGQASHQFHVQPLLCESTPGNESRQSVLMA